jgi:hypothetical protein
MTPSRYAALLLLAGAGVGLYLVNSSGAPTADPAQAARVCGLPSIGPASFYSALGVPIPTLADGTASDAGVGDCLPPDDAEDLLRKARIAASILPAWRAASLTAGQCAAGIVTVEFADPVADAAASHEELIQVCGPAPAAASTETIEQLRRLPGTAVDLGFTFGPYARPDGGPIIRRWPEGSFPAAAQQLYPCACRNRTDGGACSWSPGVGVDAGPAPYDTTLGAGTWSGAGCVRKLCSEAAGITGRRGLGYSMPASCR